MSKEPYRPLDVLWQPRTLMWALLVVLGLSLVLSVGRDATTLAHRFEQFGLFALIGYWVTLLALGALYLLRRRLANWDPIRIAWFAAGMLIAATWLTCVLIDWVAGSLLGESLPSLMIRATVIAITVGAISLGAFEAVWRNLQLRSTTRRAELAALQARVRPHFLFNTLNAAVSLVRQRPEAVETLLLNLADLFRAAIAGSQEGSIDEEIALTRQYLEIESLRFGDRLQVQWTLPDPLPALRLPLLSLQPLVENAVLHGIERRPEGGRIDIELRVAGEMAIIQVGNDLPKPGVPERVGHHVGLEAVRERIRQHTFGQGRLETRVETDRFVAVLSLPIVPENSAMR